MRHKIVVPEENGSPEQLKKNGSWPHMGSGRGEVKGWLKAVTEGDIEGDIEGKCLLGRVRSARIDDVRRWTEAARRITLDRL